MRASPQDRHEGIHLYRCIIHTLPVFFQSKRKLCVYVTFDDKCYPTRKADAHICVRYMLHVLQDKVKLINRYSLRSRILYHTRITCDA
jgi:hypothetical protein